ncbi:restriction endonuclease subunit S [Wenzhouxiangella sp. AB-CW3]|uniref:restriction endonuclease subunit S n=1 Tax=Wenzhouxiangella sp. AB-CW3 TaxID=2771012 RepID=UPI001CC2B86A|nr:restriction endonuclease subunit S [Wenzhouxiangella sp. AB-CW3]
MLVHLDLPRLATGVKPGINRNNVYAIERWIPPVEEQKRIVTILDEAFAGIETAIANTQKAKAWADKLFDSCLNRRLASIASADEIQTLSDVTELIVDCEHKTAPTQETGFPSIRTPNIGKGILLLDGVKRVSEEVYNQWTRRAKPEGGDLILAREAPAGNVGVIPADQKVCLGQRTVLIRPKRNMVKPKYLAYLLLHPDVQRRLMEKSTGATVQHINLRDIRALQLGAMPPMDVQKRDVAELEMLQESSQQALNMIDSKLKALEELKQSLLQKAFSGELTADHAEHEIESAAV